MAATRITKEDLLQAREIMPIDMAEEAIDALTSDREKTVLYGVIFDAEGVKTHYVWFPQAGRGGVCEGGNTDWTDCDSLEDLMDRWENWETRWSN